MRYKVTLASVLFVVLIAAGCSKKDSNLAQSNDPVQGLQQFIEKFNKELSASAPVISPPDQDSNQWYKHQIFASDQMSYDVEKTSSLVSPFMGKVEFRCNFRVIHGPTEQDVKNAALVDTFKDQCVLTLVQQKDRWVAKRMVCTPAAMNSFEVRDTDSNAYGQCLRTAQRIAPNVP